MLQDVKENGLSPKTYRGVTQLSVFLATMFSGREGPQHLDF